MGLWKLQKRRGQLGGGHRERGLPGAGLPGRGGAPTPPSSSLFSLETPPPFAPIVQRPAPESDPVASFLRSPASSRHKSLLCCSGDEDSWGHYAPRTVFLVAQHCQPEGWFDLALASGGGRDPCHMPRLLGFRGGFP